VIWKSSPEYHSLCGEGHLTKCDIAGMANPDKNAGPNHLRAWREYRKLTQDELAARVGTNQNMIGYLESGERGLSAKWLRRLAPALDTTPGMLLDHNPHTLSADVIDIWTSADATSPRRSSAPARTTRERSRNPARFARHHFL
jgi:transcriptional regulator with XRE-family HTH domain